MKNLKQFYPLYGLLIILNLFMYYYTEKNLEQKINFSLHHSLHNLQLNYEIWAGNNAAMADVIYSTTMNIPQVKEIMTKAWRTKDIKERDQLRLSLVNKLDKVYRSFQEHNLLQYHFVFPDNTVFLRMHKKAMYGDNISDVRDDFTKVNQTKETVRGFSEGKTSHAMRNIYPIFNNENVHIGAIEISYPSEALQHKLNIINEVHSHFLVKKSIFNSNAWDRDDNSYEYTKSTEHDDYLVTHSKRHFQQDRSDEIKLRIDLLKPQISKAMDKGEMFSLMSELNSEVKIISFYPITQNISYEVVAWIVSYEDAPFVSTAIQDTNLVQVISFFIILLLLYFISMILKQKNSLKKLLESYDKNVIFSTTDTKGVITHVSTAFCNISGYTKKELLGKQHNMIRHPDMPKASFKSMWQTIQSNKAWKGEVKNLKKDGTYYWVQAEIEPLYDGSGTVVVGYSAIRHDITTVKEIEDVQKEVIFTMGSIGESRSKETANHVKRVAEYSKLLALYYGLDAKEAEMLKQASPMHDIGKIAIPDAILLKPSSLDEKEFQIMMTHAQKGYNMLKHSQRSLLKTAAIVAHQHHEKYDGTGYPNALSGENIHIYGRITALIDVFDALGSDRVYKKAWEDARVFEFIKNERGKHFDPELVDLFFENIDEFLKIRSSLSV